MASGATAAIAAAAAHARREIRDHYEQASAFDLDHAVGYEPPDPIHEAQFRMLVGTGVLRPTGDGRHWLDLEAERRLEERRRRAAMMILKIALILAALAIALVAILPALN